MSLNTWWFTSGVEYWILYWVFYRDTKNHFPLTLLFIFTSTHFSNIKDGYKLQLQTSETIISSYKNDRQNKERRKAVELVLAKCNLVDNQYH